MLKRQTLLSALSIKKDKESQRNLIVLSKINSLVHEEDLFQLPDNSRFQDYIITGILMSAKT